jgi:hypothetical protein
MTSYFCRRQHFILGVVAFMSTVVYGLLLTNYLLSSVAMIPAITSHKNNVVMDMVTFARQADTSLVVPMERVPTLDGRRRADDTYRRQGTRNNHDFKAYPPTDITEQKSLPPTRSPLTLCARQDYKFPSMVLVTPPKPKSDSVYGGESAYVTLTVFAAEQCLTTASKRCSKKAASGVSLLVFAEDDASIKESSGTGRWRGGGVLGA